MEDNLQSLEGKVKNVNWKQWIPLVGIYVAHKDLRGGRPSLADVESLEDHSIRFFGSALYQMACMQASVITVANYIPLLEKYF